MDEALVPRAGSEAIEMAAKLADPLRRQLYEVVVDATELIGRDDAARATGISRNLAGYHLDQLVEDGLLAVTTARRSGRTGPGAGRPAKLYARAPVEVTVQLPPRDDRLVAHLLATAVEQDESGAARQRLRNATRAAGTELARALDEPTVDGIVRALESRGYSPVTTDDEIRLRNCPFHHLVDEHLELVCALNEDLLGAAVDAAEVNLVAELDPQPGRCCVVLRPPPG